MELIYITIGTYPYLAAVVNNHLHVKHIQSFKTEVGAAADMWGNGDDQEGVRNICYTVAVVTTITGDHADDNAYETAHNVDVVDSGPGSNSQLKCTASMDDAIANVAFATEIIDHFGENGDADVDNWIPYLNVGDIGNGEVSSTDVEMAANMLEADNETIATTFNTAKRIGVYIKYPNSVKISENTIGFKLNFATTRISLDSAQVVEGGVVKTWMAKVGVDPFTIVVQTKTKRRRGAWR